MKASQPSSLRAYWIWWYWSLSVLYTEVVEVMPWNRDANGKLLELRGKVLKTRLGNFMEVQFGNVLRLIKVWNFLTIWAAWHKSEFFTRSAWRDLSSTINLLFLDWGTGLKSAYIKVSVVFRKYIQTRFDQLDIKIILFQDPEKFREM